MTPTIALKIKKLLELAGKNSSQEESALAAERAQELLQKYNLTMGDVHAAEDPKADGKRVKETHKRGAMYKYQQELWTTIAQTNFCWYFTVPVYDKHGKRIVTRHHRIIGREVNVMATKIMGDYLEATINRLCPWQGRECLSRSAISWKEGCATKLRTRLVDRYTESTRVVAEPEAGSTAVALRAAYDTEYERNYAFMYGEESLLQYKERKAARAAASAEKPETNAQRIKREARQAQEQARWERRQEKRWENRDLSAWHAGSEAGRNIGLDSQVKDKHTKEIK